MLCAPLRLFIEATDAEWRFVHTFNALHPPAARSVFAQKSQRCLRRRWSCGNPLISLMISSGCTQIKTMSEYAFNRRTYVFGEVFTVQLKRDTRIQSFVCTICFPLFAVNAKQYTCWVLVPTTPIWTWTPMRFGMCNSIHHKCHCTEHKHFLGLGRHVSSQMQFYVSLYKRTANILLQGDTIAIRNFTISSEMLFRARRQPHTGTYENVFAWNTSDAWQTFIQLQQHEQCDTEIASHLSCSHTHVSM